MTTKIKYMSTNDKYNYFADRLVINQYAVISPEYVTHINKSKIYLRGRKTNIFLNKANDGLIRINITTTHNLNKIIRKWIAEELEIPNTPSSFRHNENFIPLHARKHFKDKSITISDLRTEAAKMFFKELKDVKNEVLMAIWGDKTSLKFHNLLFKHSVKIVEICYDLESPTPIEYAKSKRLKKSFDTHLKSSSQAEIIGNSGETSFAIKSVKEEQDRGRQIIKGHCWDNTQIKVYTKEICKGQVLNRLERTFDGRPQMKNYTNTSFKNEIELLDILHCLAMETYKTFLPICNIPLKFSEKSMNKIIRSNCKAYFGKHWEEAYKDLTTGSCSITTGKEGKSLQAIQGKARILAREGVFLMCDRRGVYVVDRHKIKRGN